MFDVQARLQPADVEDRVQRLGFRPDDAAALLALLPRVCADGELLARISTLAERLLAGLGDFCADGTENPWAGDWSTSASGREPDGPGWVPLLTLFATVDDVRAFHRRRGVPSDVSWASLADLGQQVHLHRLTFGGFGLETYGWLCCAWSGALYWLGRLQFNLQVEDDEWVLSTHIPRTGPLTPAAVDDAFARATDFFRRHFSEYETKSFFCESWLLDPELRDGLAEGSNIAAFSRRWGLYGEPRNGDGDALYFTFSRRPPIDLDLLPQRSSLERLIVGRLRRSEHWQVWKGRCTQPDLDDMIRATEVS